MAIKFLSPDWQLLDRIILYSIIIEYYEPNSGVDNTYLLILLIRVIVSIV